VANSVDNNVSVIDTTKNTVYTSVNVGNVPAAFGQFIGNYSIGDPAIGKKTPKLAWTPNPLASIAYGQQLDGNLDVKATDPITGTLINQPFVYTDEAGNVVTATSVLSIGTHALTATFTPMDTADHTSGGTVTNSITVTDPTTGNTVDGKFGYTDENGNVVTATSVLSVGTHTLTATFTPTNNVDYATAYATALISVIPAVQQGAALTIVKSAYPISYDSVGHTITYTYTVTNSGNVDISAPITVTDDNFGTVPIQSSGILVQVQALKEQLPTKQQIPTLMQVLRPILHLQQVHLTTNQYFTPNRCDS
jgi:YVTN family beta-propeller protein